MDGMMAGGRPVTDAIAKPEAAERRRTLRLLTCWRKACREGTLPQLSDIALADDPEIASCCFVLAVGEPPDSSIIESVGDGLAAFMDGVLPGRPVSAVPPGTLLSAALTDIAAVLDEKVPYYRVDEFIDADGRTHFYRSILLPVSDNGRDVTGILGTANSRP